MVEGFPLWGAELVKYAGAAGVIFVMWFFQQKSWQSTLNTLMEALRDERQEQLKAMAEEREKQRDEMREERNLAYQMQMKEQDRDYETQTRIFDQLSLHGGITARLEGETRAIGKSVDEMKRKILGT